MARPAEPGTLPHPPASPPRTAGDAIAPRPAPGNPRQLPPEVRRAAAVVVLGAFMSMLDSTIVNVALRSLSAGLAAPLSEVQWVVTAYLLSLAAVIPASGWAARRFGTRRTYLIAVAAFTAGSALCGLASSLGELVAFRVLQGAGGGMIMPVGTMILAKNAGSRNLPRVMGAIGTVAVLAPIAGPTVGGLLVHEAGWEWIFYVNVPVGVLAVTLGIRMLPRDRGESAGRLDVIGLVAAAAGLGGIIFGLAEVGAVGGFASAKVLAPIAAGVALLAGFAWRTLRTQWPLLDLRLYRDKTFGAAALATFSVGAAMFGGMILMPLYLQQVRHEDVVAAGLLVAPVGLGAAAGNQLAARLTGRLGGGLTAVIGGAVSTVATLPFVLVGARTSYWLLGAAMAARGVGIGLAMMPVTTSAIRFLDPSKVNDASPQLNVLQRVGGSIGTATLTVVLQHHLSQASHLAPRTPQAAQAAQAAAFGSTFSWVLTITVVGALPAVLLAVAERSRTGKAQRQAAPSAGHTAHDAVCAEEAA